MNFRTIAVVAAVCIVLAYLAARTVRHSDPLASLEAPVLSSEYSSAFWMSERRENSELWSLALERCSERSNMESRPNCAVVLVVSGKGSPNQATNLSHAPVASGPSSDEIPNGLTGHGARQVPSGSWHRDVPVSSKPTSK